MRECRSIRCLALGIPLLLAACHSTSKPPVSESKAQSAAPQEAPPPPRRLNLVLVTIDTLRPDRLGCYGNSQVETPTLDGLAKRGVLFENAVTSTPLTAPSHASIFTGLYPTGHKVRDTGGFILDGSHPTLASILHEQGWDTAAFVGSSVLKRKFGFDRGFTVYDDEMPKESSHKLQGEYAERRAGKVVDRAAAWLASRAGQPFFLWVHVFDPHSPYDPPSPFRETYRNRLYDGEVAYTDQQLGRLFAAVAQHSAPDQTLIAVLSDHGEGLADHGEYNHGVFLYDPTVRIAFLLAGPGVPAGLRVKQQARNIDLLPTVLELVGGKAPEGIAGVSLAPAFSGKDVPTDSCYLETLFPKINMGWAELRGIRTSRWKYVRAPHPELYDLSQDPGEKTNIAANHSAEVREMEGRLKTLTGGDQVEKVQTTMVDPRTMKQLQSLGYLGGASGREYALGGKGVDPKDRTAVLKLLYLAVSPDSGTTLPKRIPLLEEALRQDPADATIYFHLGDAYQQAGRAADAMKLYQNGIRNGLANAWLYSRLAYLYVRQGDPNQAISLYEKAAQLNPSDSDSLNDLGMTYLDGGKIAEAERSFQWSLAAGDESGMAYNGLGLVAVQKKDMAAARGWFEKAVRRDPDLLEARLNLGRAYKILGDNAKARASFEAFLAKASPAEYGPIIARLKAELAEMH
jgi:arylsulfatase A-like enzyme/Tfp pilus assembly protein PilF